MKKILAIAAAAALTAGVSAYAANPFSDVTPDDWAYQAVSDLSDQGVVEGYPDGTFKGERNMTRYELAQIIARLMAKEDQLNAEQKATLDKLAGEYADELANLGVRVGNLEKKVGNIYWSGDARMRYQDKSLDKADNWDGRMRINVKAQVNDSTTFNGRLTYNMNFKSDDGNNPTDDTKDNGVYMDVLNAKHYFGKDVALTLGRYANNFGNQAGWRFGDSHDFDGAELAYNNGKLNVAAGFGQFDTNYNKKADNAPVGDEDAFYARAGYDFNVAKLGVDYVKFQEGSKYTVDPKQGKTFKGDDELLGVDLLVPFGGHQRWNVQGEYVKNTTTDLDKDDAWNAGLQYSNFNWKKPGSFALGVWYNDVGDATYFGGTGLQTNVIDAFFNKDGNGNYATNVKYWNLMGDVALQKNVSLHAEYAFGADADGAEDPDDAWTVSLNYKF
ncbi:S-layer homology domain-containing protein [uncultured Dialister sp.]|uniref:S-layer homology domain-containing protein n=1 Tax=uncultured Dialister sp. TaxID=278064 RepID=UPI00261EB0A5|nr:S-layer homology domain-containing protein [uncultured Dialister sp.]